MIRVQVTPGFGSTNCEYWVDEIRHVPEADLRLCHGGGGGDEEGRWPLSGVQEFVLSLNPEITGLMKISAFHRL